MPKQVNPFYKIRAGEDSVILDEDGAEQVVFTDFRPNPQETTEDEAVVESKEPAPKEESAPESADTSGSQNQNGQQDSETNAPKNESATTEKSTDAGSETKPKVDESSSQDS